jgi:hypothetical protein
MSSRNFLRSIAGVVSLGLLAAQLPIYGQNAPVPALPADAGSFVRDAINNELKAIDSDHTRWMYRLHREDDKGSIDRQVVETTEGNLSKTLLFNGQPLNAEQREKDEQRMHELVSDPEARSRREKREKADADKARQLMKGIPDAFLFTYDGMEDGMVRVAYRPNPHYNPPSREMTVYHSMSGTLLIHPSVKRLVRLEGTLFEDVSFGWGLLGHLDKGGTFKVVQKEVGQGHWESVLVDLNIRGRAVIFKTIAVHQKQVFSGFRRVPDDITLGKALEILERPESSIVSEETKDRFVAAEKHPSAQSAH